MVHCRIQATAVLQLLTILLGFFSLSSAWIVPPSFRSSSTLSSLSSSTSLSMATTTTTNNNKKKNKKKKLNFGRNYDPKWKKQATLAETLAKDDRGSKIKDPTDVGLVGTVPVVFRQGNVTKSTMAIVGQPLSDVATQAGQFIKYGCGKGECGTCESLCNGQWIRPCMETVPQLTAETNELVITVKEVKNKSKSSGKFYSVRSFVFGFYNNVLGMVGFVRTRKYAKKNWQERQEYEENLKDLIAQKKAARAAAGDSGSGRMK